MNSYPWYGGMGFAHGLDRINLIAHDYLGLSGLDIDHGHMIKKLRKCEF